MYEYIVRKENENTLIEQSAEAGGGVGEDAETDGCIIPLR
jgi:hypothetical protein